MLSIETQERLPQTIAVKHSVVHAPDTMPTTVLGWGPIVWSRVLFRGKPSEPMPWTWRPFLALFVLSGALLYPCLSFHLFEPDEGRYAQIPREMLTANEWIVPTLQGQPYLDKPPMLYWLVMLSYSIFGFSDGAARVIPALAMQGTILATYLLGRRMIGSPAAFWGTLLLTVSPLFLGVGRLLVLDGVLTLWVTLAVYAAYLAQSDKRLSLGLWTLTAIPCGLGILTKGPVALVLVLIPLLAQRWLVRSAPISWWAWAAFAAIVCAVAMPWYIAVCVQRPEFVHYFLWQHNVERFLDPFDHIRPIWFYVPIVLFGLLPAILLALPITRFLFSLRSADSDARCPAMGYLLLAGLWCVFFFSLSGCKLPTYILPALPPLCLALGCFVARTGWHRSRWLIGAMAACWLTLACSHYYVVPLYALYRSPINNDEVLTRCGDSSVPVVCFPRNVDSVAFYAGRSDFRTYRSKQIGDLLGVLDQSPRTIVLFGHRNSPATLQRHLPPHLHMVDETTMGLCKMAVIERR